MKSELFIIAGALLLLLAAEANAAVSVQSIDLNTAILYTASDIRTDVNIAADENKAITVKLYDNNVLRGEKQGEVNSPDGNAHYFAFSFVLQLTSGNHNIDVNVFDSNSLQQLDWRQRQVSVQVNPLVDINLSWDIIQQYVLPLARSYSECVAQKSDINIMLTQAEATLKALQNDVGIAQASKEEAERLLSAKKTELDACGSARATCEADKTTLDSRLLNADSKCELEKSELQDNEEQDCEDKLLLKESVIDERGGALLAMQQGKLDMESIAMAFGCGCAGLLIFFIFLMFKGRVKL